MSPPTATEAAPDTQVTATVRTGVLSGRVPVIASGADRITGADPGWLLLGAMAAAATWVTSALAQQGAVAEALPGGRLVVAQFAASSATAYCPRASARTPPTSAS